uniref:Ankyrin repeat and death domain-containing protein 1a n=1 Tax=Tetraselmis sp. GSL018 TaxID=582737 RepID=A0A061QYB7_9CHLO|mmetsp:Transcript_16271/g.38598  ORF Transcript_16271/g.38598 Transcript_16271/m.38598 type:complete len:190 (+) Transcript_16271:168-737(+)
MASKSEETGAPVGAATGGKRSGAIADLLAHETNTIGDVITIGLHDAAEKGLTKVIEKIFDRTMDLNIDMRDKYERTALHWAAESGHAETCEMLLELGAEPAARESLGRTAIHLAARAGHLSVIESILKKLEDDEDEAKSAMNAEDNNGISPLFLARQRGDDQGMKVFEFLITNGANYEVNKWAEVSEDP